MKQGIVLGIGNRLMEDDGIGVQVVEALNHKNAPGMMNAAEKNRAVGSLRFVAGETDIDFCLSELSDHDFCIIIDGSSSGKEPGTVETYQLTEVLAQIKPIMTFHDFNLFQAMKRDNLIKEGLLITIEVASLGFSTELSPVLQRRFDEIVREVGGIINRIY